MRTIFALMHKPSFMSLTPGPVVGLFDDEKSANEALEMKRSELRKPYVQSFEVVDTDAWERDRARARQANRDAVSGDGDFYAHKYPRPSFGPGTARGRGKGYR